ncbi:gliding motility lipoprotein GldB [Flavobacterium sp.]|uniref:gliding motility lipoprotein GldB n=1 Tax=Flavobacterium sp. TaxID=239 RepID=UPI003751652E
MKKYIFIITISVLFFSCDKKSKVEKAVEEIPVEMKLHRFEQAFFDTKPSDLQTVKNNFPDFFQEGTPDQVWLDKMQHPQWRELYVEVENKYKNFNSKQDEIEELFKHIKYYFPTIKTPDIYTVIGEMDYNNKVIYANDKLLISLELFLGAKHRFYADFPEYIANNFEERQMLPEVASSFSLGVVPQAEDKTLLSEMIYYGKQLYIKDVLLADKYTDAEKIGYSPEQITWSKENEAFIWTYFIEKQYLYSSNSRLPAQFIYMAPFSKFYLEIDNESPGRIGQYIGWQIVRSFMENNPKVTVQQLIKMDAKTIFEQSKYKPKKNE